MQHRRIVALALAGLAMPAAAATIDTTGNDGGSFAAFGSPDSATYGQTFLVPPGDGTMTGFTLYLRGPRVSGSGPLNLRGYVATWDGFKAGALLYTSDTRTMNAGAQPQEFSFLTEVPVTAGARYVAFLSISGLGTQARSTFRTPFNGDVIDGSFVFLNNGTNFAALFSDTWSLIGQEDIHFKAEFDAAPPAGIPEPASWALMIGGFAGVGIAARRRRVGGGAPVR